MEKWYFAYDIREVNLFKNIQDNFSLFKSLLIIVFISLITF